MRVPFEGPPTRMTPLVTEDIVVGLEEVGEVGGVVCGMRGDVSRTQRLVMEMLDERVRSGDRHGAVAARAVTLQGESETTRNVRITQAEEATWLEGERKVTLTISVSR